MKLGAVLVLLEALVLMALIGIILTWMYGG